MYKDFNDFYEAYSEVDKEYQFKMLVYQYIEVNNTKQSLEDGTTNNMLQWLNLKGFREKLVDEIIYQAMLITIKPDDDLLLFFNESTGHYGVTYSNTKIWVKESLQDGEDIVARDLYEGYWFGDKIVHDPDYSENTPKAWYLETLGYRGRGLNGISVRW